MPFTIDNLTNEELKIARDELRQKLEDNVWEDEFDFLDTTARYNTIDNELSPIDEDSAQRCPDPRYPPTETCSVPTMVAPIYRAGLILDMDTGEVVSVPDATGRPFEITDKGTLEWALKKYAAYDAKASAAISSAVQYKEELLEEIEALPEVAARRQLIAKAENNADKIAEQAASAKTFFEKLIENAKELVKANIEDGKTFKSIFGRIEFRNTVGKVSVNDDCESDAIAYAKTVDAVSEDVSITKVKPHVLRLWKELNTLKFELQNHIEEMNNDEIAMKSKRAEEIQGILSCFNIDPPGESMKIKV